MKLRHKIIISELSVFLFITVVIILLLPTIVFSTIVENDLDKSLTLNNQVMTRIDQHFAEAISFSNTVSEDQQLFNLISDYSVKPSEAKLANIRLYLSQLIIKHNIQTNAILGLCIHSFSGSKNHVFSTVGFSDIMVDKITEYLSDENLINHNYGFLGPFQYQTNTDTVFGNTFDHAYAYTKTINRSSFYGNVTVISSFDQIKYIADSVAKQSSNYMFLYDVNPDIKSTTVDISFILENFEYANSYNEGFYKDRNSVTAIRFSDYTNWLLLTTLSRRDIINNNEAIIIIVGLLLASLGLIITIVLIPLVHKITRPLDELSQQMNLVSKGNLDVKAKVASNDEIGELSRTFNDMTMKLENYINKIILQEKHEQKLRYSLLISQVDPHFIYNTMNTITYLAQKERCGDVIKVNKAMIDILRDRLRIEVDDVFDTIRQELNVINQYLLIQNYRYMNTFKTQLNIEKGVDNLLIGKNILQPLVENAIFHGILQNKDDEGEIIGGCLKIDIATLNNIIILNISDNGKGIEEGVLKSIRNNSLQHKRGENIGIRNVMDRIRYIYANNWHFSITSKLGEGTSICIRLPIIDDKGKVY